jgi:hypothetical protein
LKILISYSSNDIDLGKDVYDYLFTIRHEVFFDKEKISGGADWNNVIEKAILNCDIFVVIVTHSSMVKEQIKKEVNLAKDNRKTIIPCIDKGVEREEVPWELNKYNQIEFEKGSELGRSLSKTINRMVKAYTKEEKTIISIESEEQNFKETDATQSLLEKP